MQFLRSTVADYQLRSRISRAIADATSNGKLTLRDAEADVCLQLVPEHPKLMLQYLRERLESNTGTGIFDDSVARLYHQPQQLLVSCHVCGRRPPTRTHRCACLGPGGNGHHEANSEGSAKLSLGFLENVHGRRYVCDHLGTCGPGREAHRKAPLAIVAGREDPSAHYRSSA